MELREDVRDDAAALLPQEEGEMRRGEIEEERRVGDQSRIAVIEYIIADNRQAHKNDLILRGHKHRMPNAWS